MPDPIGPTVPRAGGGAAAPPAIERCTRCVLPRTLKTMRFSEDGVCALCREAEEARRRGAPVGIVHDIDRVIERIRERGRGRKYDCLVGLSGGRDSSYLVHLLSRKHGLRVLAVYYRTPFTNDTIDGNVRRLTKRLGVDLVELPISRERHKAVARKFFLLWMERQLPELTNLGCAQCKLVNRDVFRVAKRYGIPSIVFGGNPYEQAQITPTLGSREDGTRAESLAWETRKVLTLARKGLFLLARAPRVLRELPIASRAALLYLNPHSTWLRFRYPGILRVDYFFHAPYDEADCERVIRDELGWELPPGCLTTWRADCTFADLKNYMFHRMTGATYLDCMLSNMVRGGILSREEALARVEGRPPAPPLRITEGLAVLGLPEDLLEKRLS